MQISRAVVAQLKNRIVDPGHIASRHQHFGQTGIRPVEGFRRQIVAQTRLPRAADLARRQRRVQANERIEPVLVACTIMSTRRSSSRNMMRSFTP